MLRFTHSKRRLFRASDRRPCVFLGASQISGGIYIKWRGPLSMWLRAKHLHTSAECTVSPVASLSSPELLSDLFTCSPNAAQAKRTGGGRGWLRTGEEGQRRRGGREREREEAISEKERSGDDNMLMMKGGRWKDTFGCRLQTDRGNEGPRGERSEGGGK